VKRCFEAFLSSQRPSLLLFSQDWAVRPMDSRRGKSCYCLMPLLSAPAMCRIHFPTTFGLNSGEEYRCHFPGPRYHTHTHTYTYVTCMFLFQKDNKGMFHVIKYIQFSLRTHWHVKWINSRFHCFVN
jgi:hypothetical protein